MKRLALAIVLTLGADYAVAAPPPGIVVVPRGWTSADDPAGADRARAVPHLGSATPAVTVQVSSPPTAGTVTLVATRFTADAPPSASAVAAVVRAEVDAFHGAARRAGLSGAAIEEQDWRERVNPGAQVVDASLAFRDTATGVATTSRLVIAASLTRLVATSGECIAQGRADAALIAACKAALATLDPGVAQVDRIVPALEPASTTPADSPPTMQAPTMQAPTMQAPTMQAPTMLQAPTMAESAHAPLPPLEVSRPAPATDRRPVFVGAGIVLFATLFWLNRRHRARLDADEESSDDR